MNYKLVIKSTKPLRSRFMECLESFPGVGRGRGNADSRMRVRHQEDGTFRGADELGNMCDHKSLEGVVDHFSRKHHKKLTPEMCE